MDSDLEKDEESEWFEPVDHEIAMAGSGLFSTILQPEKRVVLLLALIVITCLLGWSAGAFETNQDPQHSQFGPPSSGLTSAEKGERRNPSINASKALRKHLSEIHTQEASAPNNTLGTTSPNKDAAENEDQNPSKRPTQNQTPDASGSQNTDEKTVDEPVVIDLKEVLELGNEAIGEREWREASEYLEQASTAWTKKRRGKAWRAMRYNLAKAHYKNKKPDRCVAILEALLESDPKWEKPLLLLGLAAKDAEMHDKAIKFLSLYLEKGGEKTMKVCPYLEEQDAIDSASDTVKEACEDLE